MGLDIIILTDKHDQVFDSQFYSDISANNDKYSVSRTFCNFMCRQNACEGLPELDQIGEITAVDITPLYEMERYKDDNNEELHFLLETAESEEEKQEILQECRESNAKVTGNINKVENLLTQLIDKLSVIDNLPALLDDNGYDTLNSKVYFADFNNIATQGYINNNFGQDLRSFKRFVNYAKTKGATTVYFTYG